METNQISFQSLKVPIFLALIFICLTVGTNYFTHNSRLYVCNGDRDLDVYLRIDNRIDLVIQQSSDQTNNLECIAQGMPFYDRTIEYLYVTGEKGSSDLAKRYKIGETIHDEVIQIGNVLVSIKEDVIRIDSGGRNYVVFIKADKALYSPSETSYIIRPEFSSRVLEQMVQERSDTVLTKNSKLSILLD